MKLFPKSLLSVAIGSILLSSSAFALSTGAVSAGAFHPVHNSDTSGIDNYGLYIVNTDSTLHWVSAHLGLYNGTAQSVTFAGVNNGGTLSCNVWVVDESSLGFHQYTGSTTVNGSYGLTISIPAGISSAAVISGECSLPGANVNGDSYLYLAK
jgi:hypothetical protein